MADIERLFPDVQALLVEDLALFPGVAGAGIETPADLEEQLPFVRVVRGGGSSDRLNDYPRVDLDVFAGTYAGGVLLARRIQNYLLGPPPPIWQLDRATCETGVHELPWSEDNSGPRRFAMTFTFTARRVPVV